MSINLKLSSSAGGTRNVNVTRDFVTDFSGVGNDSTNNAQPLKDFNTFGIAQSLPVVVTVPTGIYRVSSNTGQFFGTGIANYTMQGTGSGTSIFKLLSPAAPLIAGGIGQVNDTTHNARIASDLTAGATSLTLSTPSEASRMPPGSKIMVTGYSVQGSVNSAFGFPTNPHFFDFVTVVSADIGTGIVAFTPALSDSYKTTWPVIGSSGGSEQPQGGPAWVYVLGPSWETTVQINDVGFTYDVSDVNVYGSGRSLTYNRCSWAGGSGKGPSPGQALAVAFNNCNLAAPVTMEVDKIIGSLTIDTCTANTSERVAKNGSNQQQHDRHP